MRGVWEAVCEESVVNEPHEDARWAWVHGGRNPGGCKQGLKSVCEGCSVDSIFPNRTVKTGEWLCGRAGVAGRRTEFSFLCGRVGLCGAV